MENEPKEFVEGYRAAQASKPISDCPYEHGIQGVKWRCGWLTAHRLIVHGNQEQKAEALAKEFK